MSSTTGLAAYVLAGIGSSSTSTPLTTYNYPNSTSSIASNTTSDTNASLFGCLSSWSSYSAWITYGNTSVTYYTTVGTEIIYGTGDVYRTTDVIPVASGNFTPTATSTSTVTLAFLTGRMSTSAFVGNSTPVDEPTCTVAPSQCSGLYASYLSSLGLPSNSPIPAITPAPSNSPDCPAYYYSPSSTCETSIFNSIPCAFTGSNVQLFYFPPQTTGTNYTQQTAGPVIYSYGPNITFTSPSVYLAFDSLGTFSSPGIPEATCTTCDQNGCRTSLSVLTTLASTTATDGVNNAILSFAPSDISTILYPVPESAVDSVVSVLAHGGPDYASVWADIEWTYLSQTTWAPKSWNPADVQHPPASAYYLNPQGIFSLNGSGLDPLGWDNWGPPGCNGYFGVPECSTIFEGLYRPVLSLPSAIRSLRPGWDSCTPWFGAFDPPIALTSVTTEAGPSLHPVSPTSATTTPTTGSSGNAEPASAHSTPTPAPTTTQAVLSSSGSGQTSAESETKPASTPESSPTAGEASSDTDKVPSSTTSIEVSADPDLDSSSTLQDTQATTNPGTEETTPASAASTNPETAITSTPEYSQASTGPGSQGTASTTEASTDRETALTSTPQESQTSATNTLGVLQSAIQSAASAASSAYDQNTILTTGDAADPTQTGSAPASSDTANAATGSEPEVGTTDGNFATSSVYNGQIEASSVIPSQDNSATYQTGLAVAVTLNSLVYSLSTATDGATVVNGQTLDSAHPVVTINGQTFSRVNSDLVVGSSTIQLSHAASGGASSDVNGASKATLVIGGATVTAQADPSQSSVITVDNSIALTIGGPAEAVNGLTLSAASSGVLADGSLISLTGASSLDTTIAIGGATLTAQADPDHSSVVLVDNSIALTIGGSVKTVDGLTLSAASSGVLADGSLIPLTGASSPADTSTSVTSTSAAGSDGSLPAITTAAVQTSASPLAISTSGSSKQASSAWLVLYGMVLGTLASLR